MYSVIRFSVRDGSSLEPLLETLRITFPERDIGPDSGVRNRVSLSVSTEPAWSEQRKTILEIIQKCSAFAASFEAEIDLAVEPEDYRSRLLIECVLDIDFIDVLQAKRMGFVITIYGQFGDQK